MIADVVKRCLKSVWRLMAILGIRPPLRLLPGSGPLVSVVMPVYNVEDYVDEAIRSVLAQRHRHLELIIIDDGSMDGSSAIARRLARTDPRVRYVRTENAGLAEARNRGARRAKGRYLTFVDSDDVIPVDAYATMVRSLEESGSDLATGNVVRIREGHPTSPSWNQKDSHTATLRAVTMIDHPLLVRDTTAWNKMFRRSYFDEQQIVFPPGRLYEDMAPITRAMSRARAIDVISDVTYRWRIRDEANSITQRRFEPRNITDKVDMLIACLDEVRHEPSLFDAMNVKIFQADLWTYASHVGEGDTAFDEQFDRAMTALWRDEFLTYLKLNSVSRLIFYAAYHFCGRDKAREALSWGSVPWQTMPVVVSDGRVLIERPEHPDLSGVPDEAFDLTRFIDVRSTLTDVAWVDGRLVLRGWSYLPQVCDASEQHVTARLVSGAGADVDVPVTRIAEPRAAMATKSPFVDLSRSGFEIVVPDGLGDGDWTLSMTATGAGITRADVVRHFTFDGSTNVAPAGFFNDGRFVSMTVAKGEPFAVHVGVPDVSVRSATIVDGRLEVEFSRDVTSARFGDLLGIVVGSRARWALPADGMRGDKPRPLQVECEGTRACVVMAADGGVVAGPWVLEAQAASGSAQLSYLPDVVWIDDVAATASGGIRVTGRSDRPGAIALLDRSGVRHERRDFPDSDGTFEVEFELTSPGLDGVGRVVPRGRYHLVGADGQNVRLSLQGARAMPVVALDDRARVQVECTPGRGVRLEMTPPLRDDERGPYARRSLARHWWHRDDGSVEVSDDVFISSFEGRSVSCHPAAIARSLRVHGFTGRIHAEIADHSVPVPDDFTPVVRFSADWFEAIGTSRWLFANTAMNVDLALSSEQHYVQTWHGTPLKRIGADIRRVLMSRAWLENADREARTAWTHLLSASEFTSEIFPRALGFDGPVLEVGSPRLDELVLDRNFARAKVRSMLGLDDERFVVLYTPTWRDDGGVSELLDVDEFARRLGDRAVLLVRAHPNVLGRSHKRKIESETAVVHDVARYPVIEELYSAADLMITDYSSTMFDFAVTKRPQIFFTPDLERYRDEVRGFYFDFDAWAPGPMVQSSDAVIDLVAERGWVDDFAERRERFVERFAPLEDGHASERVGKALGILDS